MTQVSAGLSVQHWFPEPSLAEDGTQEVYSVPVQQLENDTKAAAVPGTKKKVPYYTSQKSSKDYTTHLGSQTQIQKGFRKQRGSEKRHIKPKGQ